LQKNSGDFHADENLKGCTPLKIANTQRFFRAAHQMAMNFPEHLQFLPAGFGQATIFFLGGGWLPVTLWQFNITTKN